MERDKEKTNDHADHYGSLEKARMCREREKAPGTSYEKETESE